MKRRFLFFVTFWAALLLLQVLQKSLFMLLTPDFYGPRMASMWAVVVNGFTMDLSMSAYLAAPVLIWLGVIVWVSKKGMLTALKAYTWVAASLIGASFCLDLILYPYWGFRLETTPIFYFTSSPKAALASIAWWQAILMLVGTCVVIGAVYRFLALTFRLAMPLSPCRRRGLCTALVAVVAGLMIIPIRGGVTVSTMSPGRAYFCDDMALNNAAVNPLFNFVYSLSHANRLAESFNYFSDSEASKLLSELTAKTSPGDSLLVSVSGKPDVYLIILESFSAQLMPSLGGDPIAMRLDSIAATGLSFSNFYAESFRTVRAIATILGGYPALPSTSVLKYANKFGNMPSPTRALAQNGYETGYYYGGDINFTNLHAYLVATGFANIVSDRDFPVSERLSKWGVHDHVLFNRVLDDVRKRPSDRPYYTVIQTSSSHEPFEVPYKHLADERANAFAYADSCLGAFVDSLAASPRWSNTLIAIVPDHWGAYPQGLTDRRARHHVPFVLTGGALRGARAVIDTPGSQSAIMPTLLGMLGLDTSGLYMPRNMLSTSPYGQYAWLTEPEWFALITNPADSLRTIYTDRAADNSQSPLARRAKAFVQSVYDDLDRR